MNPYATANVISEQIARAITALIAERNIILNKRVKDKNDMHNIGVYTHHLVQLGWEGLVTEVGIPMMDGRRLMNSTPAIADDVRRGGIRKPSQWANTQHFTLVGKTHSNRRGIIVQTATGSVVEWDGKNIYDNKVVLLLVGGTYEVFRAWDFASMVSLLNDEGVNTLTKYEWLMNQGKMDVLYNSIWDDNVSDAELRTAAASAYEEGPHAAELRTAAASAYEVVPAAELRTTAASAYEVVPAAGGGGSYSPIAHN